MTIYKNKTSLFLMSLFLGIALFLSGCGKETKNIDCTPDTGEKVEATLQLGDDFDMKYTSGVLMVYQKQKLMMQIAFIDEDQRQKHLDRVKNTNMSQVWQEEGKTISYQMASNQGLVNYFIFPVGEKTYAYAATYLPKDAAEGVMKRVELKKE